MCLVLSQYYRVEVIFGTGCKYESNEKKEVKMFHDTAVI